MKKSLFLIPCLAAALWSCSDKDVVTPGQGGNETNGASTSYLSVSIVSNATGGSSRAVDDIIKDGSDKTGGDYVYGNTDENEVKSVRFYFFNADGSAASVKSDGRSYYDVPAKEINGSDDDSPFVERILDAIVVIESPSGDQVPSSLVAILNKPTTGMPEKPTLDDLNALVADYSSTTPGFLMSNSVYANLTTDQKFEEVYVTPDDFKSTPDDAKDAPVNVYVERVLAKVSLDTDNMSDDDVLDKNNKNIFKVYESTDGDQIELKNPEDVQTTAIYAKILGWNVTTTADKSYLMKNIDPTWGPTTDLFANWSYPDYRRSFWAKNPTLGTNDFSYTDFNGAGSSDGLAPGNGVTGISYTAYRNGGTYDGTENFTYVQENATLSNDENTKTNEYRTQVIVPCQLGYKDASGAFKELDIIEFMGFKYIGTSAENSVKDAILNLLANYRKKVGTSYNGLTRDDIELVSAKEYYDGQDVVGMNYYSYAKLASSEEDGEFTWAKKLGDNAATTYDEDIDDDDLQAELDKMTPIKIWKEGMTYYYVDIKHLNTADGKTASNMGYHGVVRNHWYDIEVSKIIGLGTPVYKPGEEIIPENPNPVENYLAAKLNILSWRLVKQSTTLGKK